MNRPGITPLPLKRVTLADLRNIRESKKIGLFTSRLMNNDRNLLVPNISSKSLNSRLLKLYPCPPDHKIRYE